LETSAAVSLFLYNIGIQLYGLLLWLLAPFQPKAAAWIRGRKQWAAKLQVAMASNTAPVVWMHCASLGEFEQGRPVLEALRRTHGNHLRLLLTFFSPSGYEIRHNWPGADWVFYLPLDSARNAAQFLDLVRPSVAVFVKYEFWYHYLTALQRRSVPTFLIAAALRPEQAFFKPWGGFFRQMLTSFTRIFPQNAATADLLRSIDYQAITVAGDPRYDRVRATAAENRQLPLIEAFAAGGEPILVIGSAWAEDLAVLSPAIRRQAAALKVIVAPHEIGPSDLAAVETAFAGLATIRYSRAAAELALDLRPFRVLLIDNIGMLSALYGYASVAYVGGAFGKGLHNILEAAVFGVPVLFGPRIERFPEAAALIAVGGGQRIHSAQDFDLQLMNWLQKPAERQRTGAAAAEFIAQQTGATDLIVRDINLALM
jgi:3-deoxy-D-manno-octulosonic-acid transferase